jgi:hypothetical protein
MASLEEVMAGLFGGTGAAGAEGLGGPEDPRRRRGRGPGAGGGYEGLEGQAGLQSLLPHILGLPFWGFSGAGAAAKGAGINQLPGPRPMGPGGRNLEGAGIQFEPGFPPDLAGREELPPGIDNRNPLGGANVAPGNIDTGRAFNQPPGLGLDAIPRTQGWRNVAPGFSAAAGLGYGSPGGVRGLADLLQGGGGGGRPGGGPAGPSAAGGGPGGGGGVGATGGGGSAAKAVTGGAPAPTAAAGGGGPKGGGGGRETPGLAGGVKGGKKAGPSTTGKSGGRDTPGLAGGVKGGKKGGSKTTVQKAVQGTLNQVGSAIGDVFSGNAQAKKGGGVQKAVQGTLNQVGNIVGGAVSGASKPAPKPSAGAAKQTTFKPKTGKTKPKGTSLIGGVAK